MKVVNAEQMRELDRRAMEEHGVPGVALMENAGRAVFDVIRDRYGPLEGKRATVFAGTGNNGGDGFVAARYLHEAGAQVDLRVVGEISRIGGDAKAHLDKLIAVGVLPAAGSVQPGINIDAILGTGAKGAPRAEYENAIRQLNALPGPTVAVDIPSGIESDTGAAAGDAVRADITVTFGYPKLGLFLGSGAECTGELLINDIGFDWDSLELATPFSWLRAEELRKLLHPRRKDANKGQFGHLLIVGGSRGMSGAPNMAAKAALRSGVGLVTVAAPSSVQPIIAAKMDEAMTVALPEAGGVLNADSFDEIAKSAKLMTALCLGPGMTQNQGVSELVMRVLSELDKPVVLDADGLNALAKGTIDASHRRSTMVLTPHPGECGRLLETDAAHVQKDRLSSVRTLAKKYKCIAVLKGANTLVADGRASGEPTRVAINTTGNPGMATGGSGDSLTGIIGALVGQGMDGFDAACMGVYIHGRAGDLAAKKFGERSLIAGDIIRFLPRAFRELEGDA